MVYIKIYIKFIYTDSVINAPNYFILLSLPLPTIDIIGTAIWDVDDLMIKKAYREVLRINYSD